MGIPFQIFNIDYPSVPFTLFICSLFFFEKLFFRKTMNILLLHPIISNLHSPQNIIHTDYQHRSSKVDVKINLSPFRFVSQKTSS